MPTIFLPCTTFQTLGSPTRTQSELLITSNHRDCCQIPSLEMETMTALEYNLLFIAVRRRTQSLKEEKLAWFGFSHFLNTLTFLRKGHQVSSFASWLEFHT